MPWHEQNPNVTTASNIATVFARTRFSWPLVRTLASAATFEFECAVAMILNLRWISWLGSRSRWTR